MNVLGIHYGHNCTVGLSKSGQIVSMLSEERLCRLKNATGFPSKALNEIIKLHLDGKLSNVDIITISDGTGSAAEYCLKKGIEPKPFLDYYWKSKDDLLKKINRSRLSKIKSFLSPALNKIRRIRAKAKGKKRDELMKRVCLKDKKVLFFDHHLSHAASAACFYPLTNGDKWLVFTLDGEGDDLSSTVNVFNKGNFKRISSNSKHDSLGYLYSETTAYLGMKPNEHEFKLMGMAPYSDTKQVERLSNELNEIISLTDNGEFLCEYPTSQLLSVLSKIYAFERFDVISGAIQKITEDIICKWTAYWIEQTGIKNIAVSGGVFMNVKAVKKVSEMKKVNTIFVVPSASDESLPLGSIWLANKSVDIRTKPLDDLYFGRDFKDDYIAKLISRDNLIDKFQITTFNTFQEANSVVAELLSKNEIVARCCGKEEWGARALGNRSILCNPSNFSNIERLNSKVKNRDFWMPFTPSILSEEFSNYVVNPKEIFAPYMAITFESTELARKHLVAAVHPRDFTLRPQEVLKEWNPSYHDLLYQFKLITNIGGLLNTSFNLHGEPNVGTPEEAIETVLQSGLDYVLIENYLFRKLKRN